VIEKILLPALTGSVLRAVVLHAGCPDVVVREPGSRV
jgi:hypothetical protein